MPSKYLKYRRDLSLMDGYMFFFKFWGEWPRELRCCNHNRQVSGSKPTWHLARLRYPTSLQGSR